MSPSVSKAARWISGASAVSHGWTTTGRYAAPSPSGRRRVWIDDERGWQEVAVYSGFDLAPGHRVAGPAMVEEMTTTVFVGADDELQIDGANNFLIHLPAG